MIKKNIYYSTMYLKNKKRNLTVFKSIYNHNLWKYLLINKKKDKTCLLEIINQNWYIDSLELKIINKRTSLRW